MKILWSNTKNYLTNYRKAILLQQGIVITNG